MRDSLAGALADYLTEQRGVATLVIDVRRITVGHSRAMYRVDTDAGAFVVRAEQGGVFGTSSAEEFAMMQALHGAGYPVATVRWFEPTSTVLGQPFFVMDFLAEAAVAGADDERAMSAAGAAEFVSTLAGLHALDWQAARVPFASVPTTPSDATHLQIERWAAIYRAAAPEPIPLLDEAAAWLHRYAPPLQRLSIVHGDAGPGNVVMAGDRVVAVTDWEFAHLGDPTEDWSFCLAMRGTRTLTREEWLALYERVAGVTMSESRWRYWEAFNLFKGACANRTCLTVFESGANPAPNMAIIGTTLHQVFLRRLVTITAAGA
jgi:aminoglycoside phosphotransferase (APT) family kinase protein